MNKKRSKLSEYSMVSWANDGMKKLRIFAEVYPIWVNQCVRKETEKTEEKSVQAGLMKPLKILYAKVNRNRALKARCVYCMTLNQGIFLRICSWGIELMGLRKKQGCEKNREDRIKAAYPRWAGRKRCYWLPCTTDDLGLYCNISIISNQRRLRKLRIMLAITRTGDGGI